MAFAGVLDNRGEAYIDTAFERALITFGVARSINGVISVAQGTEVAVHPAGFGVNFTPGEILDPINDLIERFSWVMLVSAASLGVQKIFLNMSASPILSVLLTILVSIMVLLLWKGNIASNAYRKQFQNLFLIILFVRFSVPVSAIASEVLYDAFLTEQYAESAQQLEQTRETISSISAETKEELQVTENEGMMDRAKKWFDSAAENINIQERIDQYQAAAADASKHAINLIAVFIMQTVILPLVFLWVVYRLLRDFGRNIVQPL
ncbi:hypothetical protein [Kaarinaea lacus]